jgi:hypothetical protein
MTCGALSDAAAAARKRALVEAAASNDVSAVGLLLGTQDANQIKSSHRPDGLARKPSGALLLDVAVGCAAVDVVKCLLEFHGARPTRETLKMAISVGNLELVRMMVGRLPESELDHRFDLAEVAADFHQLELLAWLLRDAPAGEREVFVSVMVERCLADALLVAVENGIGPLRRGDDEVVSLWTPRPVLWEIIAPAGSSRAGCGWCIDESRVVALPPVREFVLDGVLRRNVIDLVLPPGATGVGLHACSECRKLKRVAIGHGVTRIREAAFWGCVSLVEVAIPDGVTEIGRSAFSGCVSLAAVTIPLGCTRIGEHAFCSCRTLAAVTIPQGCESIGVEAFSECQSLIEVRIRDVKRIGSHAFRACTSLAVVTLPKSCVDIGDHAFGGCSSLARVKIPKGCRVGRSAFLGCPAWQASL